MYFATLKTDTLVLSEAEVTQAYKWFAKEELDNPDYKLKDSIKYYAKFALESVK